MMKRTHMVQYFLSMTLLLWISLGNFSVFAIPPEQEFQTLELVKVYESEAELRAAYPKHFPKVNQIQVKEDAIHFIDADTGRKLKQMPIQQFSMEFKTPVTEAELRQAEKPSAN